jgi:hypothetical protein
MDIDISCTSNNPNDHFIGCQSNTVLCKSDKITGPSEVAGDGQVDIIGRVPTELIHVGSVEAHDRTFISAVGVSL